MWSGATAKTEQSKTRATRQNKHRAYTPLWGEDNFTVPLSLRCVCVCVCVGGYAFMGSLIIQEVVKDLLNKGLDNAKVLLLAGSRYVPARACCGAFNA